MSVILAAVVEGPEWCGPTPVIGHVDGAQSQRLMSGESVGVDVLERWTVAEDD